MSLQRADLNNLIGRKLRKVGLVVAIATTVMFSPAAIAGKGHGPMGMVTATDMATVMRTGIIIIGTTAIDTVTVVIGAVVGTDME